MAKYLVYTLDASGRISLPEEVLAEDDEQALALIRAMGVNYRRCEIWNDHRMVAALDAAASAQSSDEAA